MRPIGELVEELGIDPDGWSPYGRWIAKVDPRRFPPERSATGKVVLVTGMTPTAHGVGKTVTMLALGAALHRAGARAISCLRQPSLGPVFGVKGGGAGGGRATVEPIGEVNLGLTGDLDAVTNAHNLLASAIDNSLHFGNPLDLDPATVAWPRAFDLEDRALRDIEVGRGTGNGPVRSSSFVITPASEITAILGLATDLEDLKDRFERIVIGRARSGRLLRAQALGVAGAMAALLRHALSPNLLQTPDGAPVLVHGGPFGNLSYGTTTLTSVHVARAVADIVLVEAGFGTDLGGEKFVDLFGPLGGLEPSAAVLVVSLPVIRAHGIGSPDPLRPGLENLDQHLANVRRFGIEPVVALNHFPDDDPAEVAAVRQFLAERSVRVESSTGFADGAAGCERVAEAVVEAARTGTEARPIYRADEPLSSKVDRICREVYGGDGADFSELAARQASDPEWQEFARAPVCLAKTPLSLSDDPKRLGRPRGFRLGVREFVPAAGAGYLVGLLGAIQTMPGLPRDPRFARISVGRDGTLEGVG
jgi:formate--tetrahydrofolate ligase